MRGWFHCRRIQHPVHMVHIRDSFPDRLGEQMRKSRTFDMEHTSRSRARNYLRKNQARTQNSRPQGQCPCKPKTQDLQGTRGMWSSTAQARRRRPRNMEAEAAVAAVATAAAMAAVAAVAAVATAAAEWMAAVRARGRD